MRTITLTPAESGLLKIGLMGINLECGHVWMAFCPQGYNDETKLECPSCRKYAGDFI